MKCRWIDSLTFLLVYDAKIDYSFLVTLGFNYIEAFQREGIAIVSYSNHTRAEANLLHCADAPLVLRYEDSFGKSRHFITAETTLRYFAISALTRE